MADFGFLSDTDDSAVEELISQAQELSVLEQISAINCSGFKDSVLPAELESRFHRLKSLPAAINTNKSKPLYHSKSELSLSRTEFVSDEKKVVFSPSKLNPEGKAASEKKLGNAQTECGSLSDEESEVFSDTKRNPDGKKSLKEKYTHGSVASPSNSSDSCLENAAFSPSKPNREEKKRERSKLKSKSGSFSSPLGSPNSWLESPSPPKKSGCFWCSPKRVSRKKSKENGALAGGLDWGKNDEFLSDLGTFSVKEQQKMLKKAKKEQEKISREAEKIVNWAKQASARMSFHGIGDKLSDDDSTKSV